MPSVELAWIDRAFVWVQHPFFALVLLLVLVVVFGLVLWGVRKRERAENAYCWDLYDQAQSEILELTGFVFEAIGLARARRDGESREALAALEVKVGQFKEQKQRDLERNRAERRARK